MEIFYTFLQYKVHLSMFHLSSISKIWYTSTWHDVHYNSVKPQNCIVEKFCTKGGQSLLSLLGTRKKNFSFHFKRYNLTICAVNFFETFCTCSPSSLGQDLMVKIAKINLKKFIWASFRVRNGKFEHFLEKNDLCPLGVNVTCLIFKSNRGYWRLDFYSLNKSL